MAQLIQHKRGRLERLSIITGSLQKGEILIVTGSSNITSSNGSAILFAATESGSVQATNRFIIGSSAPNVFPASTYGGLVNGVPYYDSGSGTLYLLGSDGNTAINLTGNISTFSASVATSFSASNASLNTLSSSISASIIEIVSQSLSSSLSVIATDFEIAIVSASLSASQNLISSSISSSIASTLSGSAASVTSLSSSVSASLTSLSASVAAGNIFQLTGSAYNTINNLEITGGVAVSGTINADNMTVGIPTANAWQSNLNGSYFNNFNSETNVSEILRFVAGLLSSSAPDASPNTRTLSSVTATAQNTTTGTALIGRIPQTSTNTTITYLNGKGFATAGSTIFASAGTIYTANYGYNYTSVAAGTTTATSSLDSQLFGLGNLSSGTPTNFKVSGSFTFRFKDNSTKTDTATSSSVVTITQTGAGTTSGVTLALINTVNPAVIPPGYQDGKFASALGQFIYSGSATAVSASGYYHISSSIQIASGSSAYSTAIAANGTEIFWAPLSTISTNVPVQTPTLVIGTYTALTATSRSLSGAPYLTGATYELSASVSGTFNPLFRDGTIATITEADSYVTSTGISTVATSTGTISTANAVYGIDNTLRSTSTIPYETDTIRLNSKFTFAPSTTENINQIGLGTTSFVATISGYNFAGTQTSTTATIPYHSGSTFGQPISSGSMAYYGASQASDASATTLYEPFLGENYRIQLADNVLAFNGTAWTTSFGVYNLGATDLQVKPGYLVKPGGTYAYWLGNPSTASEYKYYIRKFNSGATSAKSSMTLNLGKTLVAWDSATDGASVVILFESSKNTIYTPARVYDPTKTNDNEVGTITANTDGQNPFGANMTLYGNTGGSLSSTTYTIPLRSADGMFVNATYDEIYVIVRYKGDVVPVTSITTTFS